MTVTPLGDRALIATVGTTIDEATHRRVRALTARLDRAHLQGAIEIVPAFASVAVHYDPALVNFEDLARAIEPLLMELDQELLPTSARIEIPVCYGGAFGPDLPDLAASRGLTEREVIDIHSGTEYRVHMLGFAPGFPYLGGLDPRIALPRRDTPRTRVPASSVGIGGNQTGIYPIESPGGWHLIGRTPLQLFDPVRSPPALVSPGDTLVFRSITEDEFRSLERE